MKRLKIEEPAALQQLQQMSIERTEEFIQFFHEYVLAGEYWNHSGLTSFLLKTLNSVIGHAKVANWIRSAWGSMSEPARRTIIHCFAYPDLVLSTELAIELFRTASTTSWDRHGILAGLASTAQFRKCEALILDLIDQIGRHEDSVRQEVLEQFTASVKKSFGPALEEQRAVPQ